MTARVRMFMLRCLAIALCLGALRGGAQASGTFALGDTTVRLQEITPDVAVYFYAIQLNRALKQWDLEFAVSNKSARAISGPVVVLVDSFRGTSGPLQPDGLAVDPASRPFYDLSPALALAGIPPGGITTRRAISLGMSTGSPALVTRVFAGAVSSSVPLGVVRTLNDVGQPLPGVTLSITGPQGTRTQASDPVAGVASFGQGPGDYSVKFALEDHLPVWRLDVLNNAGVTVIPSARLTRRSSLRFDATPLGGVAVTNPASTIQIGVGESVFAGSASLWLTPLTGQTLPAPLPQGWSPLQAFWLETSQPVSRGLSASLIPWGPVASTESAVLVRWNETGAAWDVLQTVTGAGTNALSLTLPGPGAYALTVADTGSLAPAPAVTGQRLVGSAVTLPTDDGLSALGLVDPTSSPASKEASLVTGTATVTLNHSATPIPSGFLLRGEVSEDYHLRDNSERITPNYEQFLFGYQRPGDEDPQTLGVRFPIRPLLLFGADELGLATIQVDVLPRGAFDGVVLDANGGPVSSGNLRVLVGVGQLSEATAFRLRSISVNHLSNLVDQALSPLAGFELTFDSSRLAGTLTPQVDGLPTNTLCVLGRVIDSEGIYGLEPVLRLRTDVLGRLRSVEPAAEPRLGGLAVSGQYVLVRVPQPQALISGVVRDKSGQPESGLPVSLESSPWVSISRPDGSYRLVAPAGTSVVSTLDATTGDEGRITVTVTDPAAVLPGDIGTAPHGPRVVSISPGDGETKVPRVTSVVVRFSQAINPGTLGTDGIQLVDGAGQAVPASLSLNLKNTIVTLAPNADLNPGATYQVRLKPTLADPAGLGLEGAAQFSFTTVLSSRVDPAAQLVIYEPGATNVPAAILADIPAYTPGSDSTAIVVHGTAGAAEPGVPVILVNESTGETSTVLSKPDGSFSSLISGGVDDFVSATFVNLNGSRNYVPVSRQEFDNGFVGLYRRGGILEAQSDGGPVQVLIEPDAVLTKTKFRLKTLNAAQIAAETGGATPETAVMLGQALVLEGDGPGIQGNVKVKFTVDLRAAGYPTNADPTQAAIALVQLTNEQDVKAFQVLDQLKFTPNSANPPPTPGPRLAGTVDSDQLFYGVVESVIGLVPGSSTANSVFRYFLMPILMGGNPIIVKGVAATSLEIDKLINPFSDAASVAPGAAGKVISSASSLIDSINSKTEALVDLALGRPLAGAFISLNNIETPAIPGRLRQGMVYATSDRDGKYLMVAPTTPMLQVNPKDFYLLLATHPRFSDREEQTMHALSDVSTLAGVVYKNFVFRQPLPFASAPSVNVARSPMYPAPGEVVEVQVNASQGYLGNPTVNVFVESVVGPDPKSPPPVTDVRLFDVGSTNLAGNRTRWTGHFQASNYVQRVNLRVSVVSGNGTVHPYLPYSIDFSGEPAPSDDPIQDSDPESKQGPIVVAVTPADGGYLTEGGQITFRFSKPIARSVEKDVSGILLNGPTGARAPVVRLDSSQTELSLQYAGLNPDSEYVLTLSAPSVRDLGGNPLDQRPSTTVPDAFTYTFHTAPTRSIKLPGVTDGRGSAIHGTRLYVLDAGVENLLRTFDISNPTAPRLLSSIRVAGQPRDLVVIPDYAFKPALREVARSNDLVAVVGGDLSTIVDALDSVIVSGMYLRVFDMADPSSPVELVAATVTKRVGAVVPKIRWFPPNLVYEEFGPDLQQLVYVNLQEMLVGFRTPTAQTDLFLTGREGKDADDNGDYVGPNDVLPIPPRKVAEFYGKKQSLLITGTTQKILDFSIAGGTVGVTLTRGVGLTGGGKPNNIAYPPQYRTVSLNGADINPDAGSVSFPQNAYPSRVTLFPSLPVLVSNRLVTAPIALVSLAPDEKGHQALAVIDISLPESPKTLNIVHLPDAAVGGSLESVSQRTDGLLEAVTSSHVLVLDPQRLGLPDPPDGQLHPAVQSFIPGAGARPKSVATSDFGVRATADGGRNQVVQSAPVLSFVSFPSSTTVVDPRYLPTGDSALETLLGGMRLAISGLSPARVHVSAEQNSQLFPADPAVHYHVLVQAPGGASDKIELGLEGLSRAGLPMPNKGAGFAAVRAVSSKTLDALGIKLRQTCDATIRSLTAYRLSGNPSSPYYNYYLSRPFVLVYERMTLDEINLQRLDSDREILWSTAFVQAFIDPSENGNYAISDFAARIDTERHMVRPIAVTATRTLDLGYAPGPNVPPLSGDERMEGTLGTVSANSGEFRTETIDLTLPSPRLPISIERCIGAQDTYDGPFGLGWDFNYNQRLTRLDPSLFPEGFKMPLIPRDTAEDSIIAGSKDLLFFSGEGRIVLFQWIADQAPAEFAQDPLVKEFGYDKRATDFYLPEPGSFDLLVRFQDGQYERLTPDGTRFRYGANGRLERITDRFPLNRHFLEYDRSGWLVRIDDRSVAVDRYLEFGYYRRGADPDFTSGLDTQTVNPFLEGKICRLRDFTGRDVLFYYSDEGLLTRREGFSNQGENGGYQGRTKTHYFYKDCRITGVGVGDAGTPLFSSSTSASTSPDAKGLPVSTGGDGIVGKVKVDVPADNSSKKLNQQTSTSTQADGRKTSRTTDKWGHQKTLTVSGQGVASALTRTDYNKHGQLQQIEPPEKGTETFVFDTNNVVFRSRGNLLSKSVDPGPRGGTPYTESYAYDPRYNLPSGLHTDANGFHVSYRLSADGRFVQSIQFDAAGVETFDYDANGQLTRHADPEGVESGASYNAGGFPLTSTHGAFTTTYTYDGGMASRLGRPVSVQPPRGDPMTFEYNASLGEVRVTRGPQIDVLAYDELGRVTHAVSSMGDGTKTDVTCLFDAKGFLYDKKINGVEVDGNETLVEYQYTPDELSRVNRSCTPGGSTQRFFYDGLGHLIRMELESYVEEYKPDLHGNVLEVKQGGDVVEGTDYDGLDRPKSVHRYQGGKVYETAVDYYAGGQTHRVTITDPAYGVVSDVEYGQIDALGRVTASTIHGDAVTRDDTYVPGAGKRLAVGPRQTVEEQWNTAGYPTQRSDAIQRVTFTPDGNGNVEQALRDEDGVTFVDRFTYDGLDHPQTAADGLGDVATYKARVDGMNLEVTNPRGHKWQFAYSALGDMTGRKRADGLEFRFTHSAQRQRRYAGDAAAGYHYEYDNLFRLTRWGLRNGSEIRYQDFDPRNNPKSITFPGGHTTVDYDLLGREKGRNVAFGATTYESTTDWDALGRARVVTYKSDSDGSQNKSAFTFDKAGPLASARYSEDGAAFQVGYTYRSDLMRQSVAYPSGVVVTEERDNSGRLLAVKDTAGDIIRVTAWRGNRQPGRLVLGGVLQTDHQYDARGRLLMTRSVRLAGGTVLAHLRFQRDMADNLEVRQYLHRAGMADNFSFDDGERLSRAQVGGLPTSAQADLVRVRYDRAYGYSPDGLDLLVSTTTSGPLSPAASLPATLGGHDGFLVPASVSGGPPMNSDALGRVSGTRVWSRRPGAGQPAMVAATLTHNGLAHLVRAELADGSVEENSFQPGGLRYERRVRDAGGLRERRHYVYDLAGRLLEEYDRLGATPTLAGRYYYFDNDAPYAADLNDGSGQLRRYYFIHDNLYSVIGVVDRDGLVVERVSYDPSGQPQIEPRDSVAPVIKRVLGADGGRILIELSEPVFAAVADPGVGTGIQHFTPNFDGLVSAPAGGTTDLPVQVSGFAPFTVVVFTPKQPLEGQVSLTLAGGRLTDDWGNPVAAQSVDATVTGNAGEVYYKLAGATATSVPAVARSTVGSPFLFQGQYFDYDTGLVYMRARFYDPSLGMFLEPDPAGYEDSVNLYAGLRNNPVTFRDPEGLIGVKDYLASKFGRKPKPEGGAGAPSMTGSPGASTSRAGTGSSHGPELVNRPAGHTTDAVANQHHDYDAARKQERLARYDAEKQRRFEAKVDQHLNAAHAGADHSKRRTMSGHGSMIEGQFQVPNGTTVTFWGREGSVMMDDIGHMIESGRPTHEILAHAASQKAHWEANLQNAQTALQSAAQGTTPQALAELRKNVRRAETNVAGYDLPPLRTYRPGEMVPQHILYKGRGLDIKAGERIQVTTPTKLSWMIKPGMGEIHWAACRSLER